jgi:hypothetical protein
MFRHQFASVSEATASSFANCPVRAENRAIFSPDPSPAYRARWRNAHIADPCRHNPNDRLVRRLSRLADALTNTDGDHTAIAPPDPSSPAALPERRTPRYRYAGSGIIIVPSPRRSLTARLTRSVFRDPDSRWEPTQLYLSREHYARGCSPLTPQDNPRISRLLRS